MKCAPQQELPRGFVSHGFDRGTEELKIELHLMPVPLDRLRSLFDVGDDFEMHDPYPLDEVKADVLAALVSETRESTTSSCSAAGVAAEGARVGSSVVRTTYDKMRRSVSSAVSMPSRSTSRWVTARMRMGP